MKHLVIIIVILIMSNIAMAEDTLHRSNADDITIVRNFRRHGHGHRCRGSIYNDRDRMDWEAHEAQMKYLEAATEAAKQRAVLDRLTIEGMHEPTQRERRHNYLRGRRYLNRR
jgi:predicted acetyltransferase